MARLPAGSELALGYVTVVAETSGIPAQLRQAFGNAGAEAGRAGGQSAAGGMLDNLKGMGAAGVAAALGTAFIGAGALVAKTFYGALQKGFEQQRDIGVTQARLGLDDATMQKLASAAGGAYANAFGESVSENLDAARRAIQSGLLDPNANRADTQQVLEQLNTVTDVLGEDLPKVARAAGQAIKTGIAVDATQAFDLLVAGERAGLNVSEDLLDTVIEYATQFRKLGLSGEEAFGLMSQAAKGGARDTDTAADAIKEFSIRVLDGSESSAEAFEAVGLNAEEMTAKFSEGGEVARESVRDLINRIRELDDPVKQNAVSVGLFGTKAEDLGAALNALNLDTAVDALGKVGGAAADASAAMGGPASSLTSAQRSIEVASDQIALALAQAFGPELAKVADWVSTHQPEILGFLGAVADGVLFGSEVLMGMGYWALKAGEYLIAGLGHGLGTITGPLGTIASTIGTLTGNQTMKDLGADLLSVKQSMLDAGSAAGEMAGWVADTAIPKLGDLRGSVGENIAAMQNAAMVTRALGAEVEMLPSEHELILKSNTPEQTAALAELGLKVEQLPDGTFKVTANTAEGQVIVDDFIARNNGRTIALTPQLIGEINTNVANIESRWTRADGGIRVPSFADGKLPDQAIVQQGRGTGLVQWAEGETGGEAFIPLAASKRERSLAIWAEVGKRFGIITMADGGLTLAQDWLRGEDGKPYQYGGVGNPSWDCSGIASGAFAKATGQPVKRYFTTDSNFGALGWQSGPGGPADLTIGTNGGSGTGGHMSGRMGDLKFESSGTDGVEVGAGAQDPSNFPQQWHWPLGGNPSGAGLGGSGAGAGGTGAGSGGASGGGAAGGGAGGGASAGGVNIGGVDIPAGVTPVWIVGSSASSSSTTTPSDPSTVAPDSAQTPTPTATTPEGVQTLEEAWNTGLGRFGDAGTSFFEGQVDDALGTVGLSRSGGAIPTLVQTLWDTMTAAMASELNKRNAYQASAASQFGGSR